MNKEELIDVLTYNLGMTDYIDVTKYISNLEQENKQLQTTVDNCKEIINKALEYIEQHKEIRNHYEPYGTPTGIPNYMTTCISGYYDLLEILKGENNE